MVSGQEKRHFRKRERIEYEHKCRDGVGMNMTSAAGSKDRPSV